MPLGAFRLNSIAKVLSAGAAGRTALSITAIGDAQIDTAQSKFGGASGLFDGTGDGLNLGTPVLPATADWTVEMWVYPTSIVATDYLFAQYSAGTSGRTTFYHTNTGAVGLFINGGPSITTTGTISTGSWQHIAWVRNGSSFKIYINGTEEGSGTGSPSIQQINSIVGAQDSSGANGFIGNIDEVRISDTARYTAGFTPSTTAFSNDSNTLGLIHCDGADGSTTFTDDTSTPAPGPTFRSDADAANLDLSLPFDNSFTSDDVAFEINGSLLGAKTKTGPGQRFEFQTSDYYWGQGAGASPVGNAQISTSQNQFGSSSLSLDGTGDWLIVDNSRTRFQFGSNDFTIEAWINPTSIYTVGSPIEPIWNKYNTSNSQRMLSFGIYDGFLGYFWASSGASGNAVQTTQAISTGSWKHIALVREGNTWSVYYDGTRVDTRTLAVTLHASTDPVYIGSYFGTANNEINGYIDELRVSDTARYSGTSYTVPTSAFTPDANTLQLYHMEGSNGSTKFTDSVYLDYGGAMQGDQVGTQVGGVYAVTYDLSSQSGSGFGSAASASYTLECYIRATNSTANNNWCFSSADSGGRWLFGVNSGGTYSFGNENNIGLGDTNWHHIAIVCDGGTKRFYTDGIYKGAWVSSNTGFNTLHVAEFNGGDGNCFRGQINDLRVYQSNAKYSGTSTTSANFTLPSSIIESF